MCPGSATVPQSSLNMCACTTNFHKADNLSEHSLVERASNTRGHCQHELLIKEQIQHRLERASNSVGFPLVPWCILTPRSSYESAGLRDCLSKAREDSHQTQLNVGPERLQPPPPPATKTTDSLWGLGALQCLAGEQLSQATWTETYWNSCFAGSRCTWKWSMFGIHIVSLGKKGNLKRLEIQLPTHLTPFPVVMQNWTINLIELFWVWNGSHFMASWAKANGTFSVGTLLQKDVQSWPPQTQYLGIWNLIPQNPSAKSRIPGSLDDMWGKDGMSQQDCCYTCRWRLCDALSWRWQPVAS